jgi:hypothetical protein
MGGTVIVTLARRSLLAVSAGAAFMVPASLALIRLLFHDAVTRRTAVAMWGLAAESHWRPVPSSAA